MPIRFACPNCKQKLSVSSRKAGTKADCPRCKQSITIPTPPAPAPAAAAKEEEDLEPSSAAADEAPPPEPAPLQDSPPIADEHEPYPTFGGYEETVVVYDSPEEPARAAPSASDQQDLVTVPRYVLYVQGGLLAVLALASFTIGLLVGGAFGGGPEGPREPQACTITGTVNYVAGGRNLPDMGAVVVVVPQNELRPDEKAPIDGLRPEDPTPDETHRGIAILREFGGGYAKTDDKGRYEIRVPDRGRYHVLVISHERQARTADNIGTADILKLGPFFDNAADLLGRHRYQLTMEIVRGDKQHNVYFE
jgi:hypothetical protein